MFQSLIMQEKEIIGGSFYNEKCLLKIVPSKHTSHVTIDFFILNGFKVTVVNVGWWGPHSGDLEFGPRSMQENCFLLITYNGIEHTTPFCLQVSCRRWYLSVISPVLTVSSEELTFRQWSYENHGLIWRCGAES
jgi:hypothetical protein